MSKPVDAPRSVSGHSADASSRPDSDLARDAVVYRAVLKGTWWRIREIHGEERLSHPSRFEARFVTDAGDLLDPDTLAGSEAAVVVERGGLAVRRMPGFVSEAWISATVTGSPELHAVVESYLARLRFRSNCRVFRDMTAPEIVAKVLDEAGIDCERRLAQSYLRRPYCVQFRETDFHFVHRLLEEEGIFYACRDKLDGGGRDHRVMLGDGKQAYQPIAGPKQVPWRSATTLAALEESVHEIAVRSALSSGKVLLRDWNLEKPSLPMDASADVPRGAKQAIYYDYPGKYELPEQGRRRAEIAAEAIACANQILKGTCDVARFECGRTFELGDGPAGLGGELAIVALRHRWRRQESTATAGEAERSLSFEALPAAVVYRPPRVTPAPVIAGPITGFVTGPKGADIHTDEFGRVKVHFPWDRWQPRDDNASHWIPVLQDNTGHSAAIPRVGWEVLCDFIEGDPDRPYVLGRVYNGIDRFPEPLPDNKTKTALRSLSSPGRDGQNQIWIDDQGGSELMAVQAEKDQNVVAANDKTEDVLNTEANTVVADETITIGGNNTVKVGDAYALKVNGAQAIQVAGSRTRKVGDTEEVAVNGDRSLKIGGAHIRRIGGFDNALAKGIGEKVGGVDVEVSLKKNATLAAAFEALTVGGAVVELTAAGKVEDTKMLRVETIGAILYSGAKMLLTQNTLGKRSTTVGGMLMATAAKITLKASATLLATLKGQADLIAADTLIVKSGSSVVTINKDGIAMKSDGDVKITASGAAKLMADKASLVKG